MYNVNIYYRTVFCLCRVFKKCSSWIKAFHLSDNNGESDSNNKIYPNSWFWKYLDKNLDYYSLEIYNANADELLDQYALAMNILDN